MRIGWLAAIAAPLVLAACVKAGGPPLSSKDKLFLKQVEELGSRLTGDGAQTTALEVGKAFCVELRAGASQVQAHDTLLDEYPAVSLETIHDAATAANLIYCPEKRP